MKQRDTHVFETFVRFVTTLQIYINGFRMYMQRTSAGDFYSELHVMVVVNYRSTKWGNEPVT